MRDTTDIPLPRDDFVLEDVLVELGARLRDSGQFAHVTDTEVRKFRQLLWPLQGTGPDGSKDLPLYMDGLRYVVGEKVKTVQALHSELQKHSVPVKDQPDWNRVRTIAAKDPPFPASKSTLWIRHPRASGRGESSSTS